MSRAHLAEGARGPRDRPSVATIRFDATGQLVDESLPRRMELMKDDRVPLGVEDDTHAAHRRLDVLCADANTLRLEAGDEGVEIGNLERDAAARVGARRAARAHEEREAAAAR